MSKVAKCQKRLEDAPVGSVFVDPFDALGNAPVVGCKNSRGFWQILGETDDDRVWINSSVADASKGRARIVYTPKGAPHV